MPAPRSDEQVKLRLRLFQLAALSVFAALLYAGLVEELTVIRRYRLPLAAAAIGVDREVIWLPHRDPIGAESAVPSVVALDTATGNMRPPIELALAKYGSKLAVGPLGAWVAGGENSAELFYLDPRTNMVTTTIAVGVPISHLAVTNDAIWAVTFELLRIEPQRVLYGGKPTVVRIDPVTHAVVPVVSNLGGGPLLAAFDSIWLFDSNNESVHRIDPRTNTVVANIPVRLAIGQTAPAGLVRELIAGEGYVWLVCGRATLTPQPSWVARIDPTTNRLLAGKVEIANSAHFAAGGGFLWVATYDQGIGPRLLRFDPRTLKPVGEPMKVSPFVSRMAYGFDSLITVAVYANPETHPTIVQQYAFRPRWRRWFSRAVK